MRREGPYEKLLRLQLSVQKEEDPLQQAAGCRWLMGRNFSEVDRQNKLATIIAGELGHIINQPVMVVISQAIMGKPRVTPAIYD